MTPPLRTLALLVAAVTLLGLAASAHAVPTRMEQRLVNRINDVREARGLRALRVAPTLQSGAHRWARHLRRADSFYHARLASGTGEIIAWGTCSWFTPRQAVRAWLGSPSHRTLLLKRSFRAVGAGWSSGSWRGYSCVEMAVARFR